jgi:hypothetical protein
VAALAHRQQPVPGGPCVELGTPQRGTVLFAAKVRCRWQGIHALPCEFPCVAEQPGHGSLLAAGLGSDVCEYLARKVHAHLFAPSSSLPRAGHDFTRSVLCGRPPASLVCTRMVIVRMAAPFLVARAVPLRRLRRARLCTMLKVQKSPIRGPPLGGTIERVGRRRREPGSMLPLLVGLTLRGMNPALPAWWVGVGGQVGGLDVHHVGIPRRRRVPRVLCHEVIRLMACGLAPVSPSLKYHLWCTQISAGSS